MMIYGHIWPISTRIPALHSGWDRCGIFCTVKGTPWGLRLRRNVEALGSGATATSLEETGWQGAIWFRNAKNPRPTCLFDSLCNLSADVLSSCSMVEMLVLQRQCSSSMCQEQADKHMADELARAEAEVRLKIAWMGLSQNCHLSKETEKDDNPVDFCWCSLTFLN